MMPRRLFSNGSSCALLLAVSLLLVGCGDDGAADVSEARLVTVTRGEIRITVTEGGDLESGNPVIIRSPIEGRTTIIDMVPEGSYVKEGDFLIRLDSANLEDRLNTTESALERARSDWAQAKESVEIQQKKNSENIKSADTAWILAKRALEGYIESEYPLELKRLRSEVLLSEADMVSKKGIAEASDRLFKKKFLSGTDLERDQLNYKRAAEQFEIAKGQLELLENWTKPDQIKRLQTDAEIKQLALERVKQQATSEMLQQKDVLGARERAHKLALEARDKVKAQFESVELHAPTSGLVVYAREKRRRHSGGEPISVGTEVREREEIIRLPDLSKMRVEVDIHESAIKKVAQGQPANVRVDAIQNKVFPGTVQHVSLVPSSQSSWMNPDLKVYTVMVSVDVEVDGIKPGMHAQAEILVGEVADALQIPVQAVHQSGDRSFVFVPNGKETELREVKLGQNNISMVQVLEGLEEGDQVYQVPPVDRPKLPKPENVDMTDRESAPAAARTPGRGRETRGGAPGMNGGDHKSRGEGRGGRRKMTPEQRAKWKERMANMTPEEREKMMKRFRGNRRSEGGKPPTRNDQD
jgi:HlyD family secretion protein